MQTTKEPNPGQASPVEAARVAIWRLFEEGYVDEDMATAGLLAVDLGTRRRQQQHPRPARREPRARTDRRHRAA
jgi:hypothetical protein